MTRIPGYKYADYKMVLYPNTDVGDKIQQVKKEFSEEYKIEKRFESKPYLTLLNFTQFEMMEERLVNRLKTIACGYEPFMLDLNGYGSSPSHTIYINVESKQTVQHLLKELTSAQKIMTLNKENKPHFMRDPHFVLAGKLLPWQYEKGWLHYSHLHFRERFMAGEMALLKRPSPASSDIDAHKKNYPLLQRFEFMNMPVSSKQGDLFM